MAEIMSFLAREWIIGFSACALFFVVVYLIFSIRLVISCRKIGYDVSISGMIPLWNIIVWVRKKIFIHNNNKPILDDELIEL